MSALTVASAQLVAECARERLPALRRRPVPVVEPCPALRVTPDVDPSPLPGAQGVLTLAADERSGLAPFARRVSGSPWRAARTLVECADAPAPEATPTDRLPEPGTWAGQVLRAALEVAAGLRPPTQLVRWVSEEVYVRLARRSTLARRPGQRSTSFRAVVQKVLVSQPRDGVVEASALFSDGQRMHAAALRLEGLDGRWQVTALETAWCPGDRLEPCSG